MRLPLHDRVMALPALVKYYAVTFLFPARLVIDQQWTANHYSMYEIIALLAMAALILTVGYKILTADKTVRRRNLFLFFLVWLLAGMFLHSHMLMPLDMTVADRWFYAPMIGLLGLMGLGIEKVRLKPTAAVCLAIAIIGLLSVRTFARSLDWSDMTTLYSHDLQQHPENYHLANKYAAELLRVNDLDEAESVLKRALIANPGYGPVNTNLGYIYEQRKEYKRARSYYQKALRSEDFGDVNKTYDALARLELFQFHNPRVAKELVVTGLKKYPGDRALTIDLAFSEYAVGNRTTALHIAQKLRTTDASPRVRNLLYAIEHNLPFQ
jgi:Flp pilus assembly protein TadD